MATTTEAAPLSCMMSDAELAREHYRLDQADVFEIASQHDRWIHNTRLNAIRAEMMKRGLLR